MKFEKQDLDLEQGLKKEWIITNGLGGYSSSTIIGANKKVSRIISCTII